MGSQELRRSGTLASAGTGSIEDDQLKKVKCKHCHHLIVKILANPQSYWTHKKFTKDLLGGEICANTWNGFHCGCNNPEPE
jgi:hypothetical protein